MKTQRLIFKWLVVAIISATIIQFAIVMPSASAQSEEPPTATLSVPETIDVNQDGLSDDIPPEELNDAFSSESSNEPLNGFLLQSSEPILIGMIQTGLYTTPQNRLMGLGFSVTLIPPTSDLLVLQEYDVVYLPLAWADGIGAYQTIEAHASDYLAYVNQGGGLFVEQPNPSQQPGGLATPTLLPYSITFQYAYDPADSPQIVDPNHFITEGLTSTEMPFPFDQMIDIDPAYHVIVAGSATGSPSLVVAQYGSGHVLVETAHPSYSALNPFSDEVYRRMIEWVGSDVYDCSGVVLSPISQAVFDEVESDQEFCGNNYDGLIILPTGEAAFQRFDDLAQNARYEVDFTTMLWDEDITELGVGPGRTFLAGVKELHSKVVNPDNADFYSEGVLVRILIGLRKNPLDLPTFFGTPLPWKDVYQDQHARVMQDLTELEIPLVDTNWQLEVALYTMQEPGTHSHVKLMIVDGNKIVTGGYNMQYIYLNGSSRRDMGVEVSGPISFRSLKIFDQMWANAISCIEVSQDGDCIESPVTLQHHPALNNVTSVGDDIVFSLYRDHDDKSADKAIGAAINAAVSNVNIMQNRFMNNLWFNPLYARAILDVLQKEDTQVRVNILVSGGLEDMTISSGGLCDLERSLGVEDPSKLQYLTARSTNNSMHTKALSIDNSFIVVGSQNFDKSAWGNDPSKIDWGDLVEYSLGIDNEDAAITFDNTFNEEWEHNSSPAGCYNLQDSNTLQSKIDEAEVGSTIIISEGVYTESVTINKPLTLIGADANQTIFQPTNDEPAFRITSSDVTVANMKISDGDSYGIELIDSSPSSLKNIQIYRVVFENNAQGGVLAQGLIPGSPMNYTIENSTFVGGASGITIDMLEIQTVRSIIRNNIFYGQLAAPIQILSESDSHVEYSYNLFDDCEEGDCAIFWVSGSISPSSSVHDNLFDVNPGFSNPEYGAYQLHAGSPAVDAGDPSKLHELYFDGNSDEIVQIDIGAFEHVPFTNLSPVVTAGTDQTVQLGNSVTVNSFYSDEDNTEDHSARIDWGDGMVEDVPVNSTAPNTGEVVSTHTYTNLGTYTVEICVTDSYGGVGCDTTNVIVSLSSIPVSFYLHGNGSNANPVTLYLDTTSPANAIAKYKDSTSVNFNNGNPWKDIGAWVLGPEQISGELTDINNLQVWLGLKNSDDQGTNFDLQVELYRNNILIGSNEELCVTDITRNANLAKQVTLSIDELIPADFDGVTDILSLKIKTRIGTNGSGGMCGGHNNAVGLRLYFDASHRSSNFESMIAP